MFNLGKSFRTVSLIQNTEKESSIVLKKVFEERFGRNVFKGDNYSIHPLNKFLRRS
jgi:hypothetical protein